MDAAQRLMEGWQRSETQVDTVLGKPTWKTHPKFNPVSFLVLLITKDFIMFKALEKL